MVTDLTGDDISEIVILKRRGFVILGVPERIGDETKGGNPVITVAIVSV